MMRARLFAAVFCLIASSALAQPATQAPSGAPIATTTVLGLVKPDGTSITINGSGVISSTSVGGTPGGSNYQVQFNSSGAFSGLPYGTSGQCLQSSGSTAAPVWGSCGGVTSPFNFTTATTFTGTYSLSTTGNTGGAGTLTIPDTADITGDLAAALPSATTSQFYLGTGASGVSQPGTVGTGCTIASATLNCLQLGTVAGTAADASTVTLKANNGSDFSSIPTAQLNLGIVGSPYTSHLRACVAKITAGTGNCRMLFVGDSTTFGEYSNATAINYVTNSYPSVLMTLLNNLFSGVGNLSGAGTPVATRNARMGFGGGFGAVYAATGDSTFTLGSWALGSYPTSVTIAGPMLTASATTTSPMIWAPPSPVNGFTIWYWKSGTAYSFTYTIDSGTPVTVSSGTGTAAIQSLAVAVSQGTHTISLNWVSGNPYIIGFEGPSALPNFELINSGWPGAESYNWASATYDNASYSPINTITALAPDVTVIDLGINDANNSVGVPNYTTYMTTLASTALLSGDCIIVSQNAVSSATISTTVQQGYVAAAQSVAAAKGCAYIDNYDVLGSYTQNNALGLYYNTVHYNGAGYALMAKNLFNQMFLQ